MSASACVHVCSETKSKPFSALPSPTYVHATFVLIPDLCTEAGTSVNGGQSVLNPWYIIGGVASAVCTKDEFVMYDGRLIMYFGNTLDLCKSIHGHWKLRFG